MDARRALSFSRLDEVMPDVDRLLDGHRAVGNWTLGQVCNHLAWTIRLSVEGFPAKAPWIARVTVLRFVKRWVLSKGRIPAGGPLPKRFEPKSGLDDRAEAEALRATIRLFAAEAGPLAEHPYFGRLNVDEWNRFHCIHCGHHLGFLRPGTDVDS